MSAPTRDEKRARLLILLGAIGVAIGVALSGSVGRGTGGVILIAGWLALVVGVHRFGRLGAPARE